MGGMLVWYACPAVKLLPPPPVLTLIYQAEKIVITQFLSVSEIAGKCLGDCRTR